MDCFPHALQLGEQLKSRRLHRDLTQPLLASLSRPAWHTRFYASVLGALDCELPGNA